MSKSTYKKAMQKLRAIQQEKNYVRSTNPQTVFISSKDNPVELITATFGSPRTFEVEYRRTAIGEARFRLGKRHKVPRV